MLFRNYSSRHLSYGHLTRNKQRWDASSRDEEETTRKKTQQIFPSSGIADASQTNGAGDALLRIILTKKPAATLVTFLPVARRGRRRRRGAMTSVFKLNASCLRQ